MADALIESFVALPGVVKLTAKAFQFEAGSYGSQTAVTLDQLQKLNAGTMPLPEKTMLAASAEKQLQVLIKEAGSFAASAKLATLPVGALSQLPPATWDEFEQTAKKLDGLSNAKLQPIVAAVKAEIAKDYGMSDEKAASLSKPAPPAVKWAKFERKKMFTSTPVKLREATQMYQPVYGTSSGSRYFVVAANDDLRVAARIEAGTLSIRIEGPHWVKHAKAIAAFGFTNVNADKGYASMHLNVGDMAAGRKALGAVIAGLGIQMDTVVPDLQLLQA